MTMSNVMNRELQCRLRSIGLRDCYVTAGCLFQTVWNHQCGRPPQWGIKDYDVFYFDDNDLSWEAENQAIQRVAEATADISIAIEVKKSGSSPLVVSRPIRQRLPGVEVQPRWN